MSDGLVVASCGWYCLMDSKSPVSATMVVNFFSELSDEVSDMRLL